MPSTQPQPDSPILVDKTLSFEQQNRVLRKQLNDLNRRLYKIRERDAKIEKLDDRHDEEWETLQTSHERARERLDERHQRELDKLDTRIVQEDDEMKHRHEREMDRLCEKYDFIIQHDNEDVETHDDDVPEEDDIASLATKIE